VNCSIQNLRCDAILHGLQNTPIYVHCYEHFTCDNVSIYLDDMFVDLDVFAVLVVHSSNVDIVSSTGQCQTILCTSRMVTAQTRGVSRYPTLMPKHDDVKDVYVEEKTT